MNISTDQAFELAVLAQAEGKLQEAAAHYEAVLQSQPEHPDANYRLGLLAMSQGHAANALSFFINAVTANPNIEQYWFSYVECLITLGKFKDAENMLIELRQAGASTTGIADLEILIRKAPSESGGTKQTKLSVSQRRKRVSNKKLRKRLHRASNQGHPPEQELTTLLKLYQGGQLADAEKLAVHITENFPGHQFGWKILGAIFKKTGRLEESLIASQRSVQLSPNDAEAHNNLGAVVKEMGKLTDAEACYRTAISLDNNNAAAHSNLGKTLHEQGKLHEADAAFRAALQIDPSLTGARYELGQVLFKNGRYEKAIEQFLLVDSKESEGFLLRCSYLVDDPYAFEAKVHRYIGKYAADPLIGSVISCAERKYDLTISNPFCGKPLSHLVTSDLRESCNFNAVFGKPINSIVANQDFERMEQGILVNGFQSAGNIFTHPKLKETNAEQVIRKEIARYKDQFRNSGEGFINHWPESYELSGWIIHMASGGRLKAHIHERGWISGSLYIEVPLINDNDGGSLVVCASDQERDLDVNSPGSQVINVSTALLCMFPSSLYHYTLPYQAEQPRTVLAFDMMPKR